MKSLLKPYSFRNDDVRFVISLFHKVKNVSHIFAADKTNAWRGTCVCGFYTQLQGTREDAEVVVINHIQDLVIETETALADHKRRIQPPPMEPQKKVKKSSLLFKRD